LAATDAGAEDKSQYTLFNPTPVDKMRAFNTDRPTKSNVPYTVDAGHFQYEGDLFIYGYDNISTPDTNITSWTVGNPTFKLGLLNNVDFEVNFSFYNSIRSATVSTRRLFDRARLRRHLHALQMEPVRQRRRRAGSGADPLCEVAHGPMAPQGVGNGYIEGGLIAPFAMPLPGGFTAILMGEMDIVKNAFDGNYRVNIPALLNISHPIIENVTAYAEIFTNWSTNPQAPNIVTADFAIA
jgi:hypothetical protein